MKNSIIKIDDLINIINKFTNHYKKPPIVMRPPELDFRHNPIPEKWDEFPKFQEKSKKMSDGDLKLYHRLAKERNIYPNKYFIYEGYKLLKKHGDQYEKIIRIHKELYKCYLFTLKKYQSQVNASIKINGIEYCIAEFYPGSYNKKGYCFTKHVMNCDCVDECGAIKTVKKFKSTSLNSLQWNKKKCKYERLFNKVTLGEKYLLHSGSFYSNICKNTITIVCVPHNLYSVIEPMKIILFACDRKD